MLVCFDRVRPSQAASLLSSKTVDLPTSKHRSKPHTAATVSETPSIDSEAVLAAAAKAGAAAAFAHYPTITVHGAPDYPPSLARRASSDSVRAAPGGLKRVSMSPQSSSKRGIVWKADSQICAIREFASEQAPMCVNERRRMLAAQNYVAPPNLLLPPTTFVRGAESTEVAAQVR
jgi:hypothetical protein